MNNDERNYINRVNKPKQQNIPLFGKNFTNNIHQKIINKVQGVSNNPSMNQRNQSSDKAESVMQSDILVRKAVKDLVESLQDLNDKEIAQKLIAEHIFMLNNIFKMFE